MKKILFVAIPSIHFVRWVKQLYDLNVELYFFNIRNLKLEGEIDFLNIITPKDIKCIRPFKGESYLKNKNYKLYELIEPVVSIIGKTKFEKILKTIEPDIVHAFELNTSAYPIVSILKKYKKIKFIYSCWGSDLFFFGQIQSHRHKVISLLKRVDYLFTDCERDKELAYKYGFNGNYLGNIPGGGGYKLETIKIVKEFEKEDIIIIKGYDNFFGRGLNILKAIEQISNRLMDYKFIIFGANKNVVDYVNSNNYFRNKVFLLIDKDKKMKHEELLSLFKKSKIYVGNSISDGIPNTLIEAMLLGVFPIQSNPGGATKELISNGVNGLLIENPEDLKKISELVIKAILNEDLINKAVLFNLDFAREKYNYKSVKEKVIEAYRKVLSE